MSDLDTTVKQGLSFLDNQYTSTILTIFLIVYGSHTAQPLPNFIIGWFQQNWFRFVVFFLIAYNRTKNPTLSAVSALAFIVTIMAINYLDVGRYVESAQQKIINTYDALTDDSVSGVSEDKSHAAVDGAGEIGSGYASA